MSERPALDDLLDKARSRVARMTTAEREEMHRAQRESWVRGNMGLSRRSSRVTEALARRQKLRRTGSVVVYALVAAAVLAGVSAVNFVYYAAVCDGTSLVGYLRWALIRGGC